MLDHLSVVATGLFHPDGSLLSRQWLQVTLDTILDIIGLINTFDGPPPKKINKNNHFEGLFFWGGVIFFDSPRLHSLSNAVFVLCFPSFKHSIFSNLHIRLLDWALPRRQLATCCRFPLINIIKTYKMGHWGSQAWTRDHRGHVRIHWHTVNHSELVLSYRAQVCQNLIRTLYINK